MGIWKNKQENFKLHETKATIHEQITYFTQA